MILRISAYSAPASLPTTTAPATFLLYSMSTQLKSILLPHSLCAAPTPESQLQLPVLSTCYPISLFHFCPSPLILLSLLLLPVLSTSCPNASFHICSMSSLSTTSAPESQLLLLVICIPCSLKLY